MPRKGRGWEGYYDARWRDKGRKSTTAQGREARRQEATTSCDTRRKKTSVSVSLTGCPYSVIVVVSAMAGNRGSSDDEPSEPVGRQVGWKMKRSN
jgi:hypothetical protein